MKLRASEQLMLKRHWRLTRRGECGCRDKVALTSRVRLLVGSTAPNYSRSPIIDRIHAMATTNSSVPPGS